MRSTVEYEVIDKSRAVIRVYHVRETDAGTWQVFCDTDDKVVSNGHQTESQANTVANATVRYWRDTYLIKTGESCAIRVHRP